MTKPQKIEGGKKLVLVNWTDSLREDSAWVFVADEDFDDFPAKLEQESVGWIVKETKDYLSLAHSRSAFVYEDGDNSVIRSLTIPKCAIRKITNL